MTPEEVAYNLELLRSTGKEEDIAEADRLETAYRNQLQARDAVNAEFSGLGAEFGRLGNSITGLFDSAVQGIKALNQRSIDNSTPEALARTTSRASNLANGLGVAGNALASVPETVSNFANDFNDPAARAARLAAERSGIDQVGNFPQSASIIDNAVAQAQVAPAPVVAQPTLVPVDPAQALTQEQDAINFAANQQAAEQQQLQLIAQLEAEQALAQAQQIQFAVDQDNLLRTQEQLRLLQVPQANPNDLRNIAALSQTPAITAAPNNFANTVNLNQSIVGNTSPVNQLPATQANLQQQRRVNSTTQNAQNQVTRQQQRALELARQAYIQQVALPVFQRPR